MIFTKLFFGLLFSFALLGLQGGKLHAQGQFSSIARVVASESRLSQQDQALVVQIGLSQPVPWRLSYLADPPRLVVDFREVDFTGLDLARLPLGAGNMVTELRAGPLRAGWSRLVIAMDGPRIAHRAEMRTDLTGAASAALRLRLIPASDADFAAEIARPEPEGWALPQPAIMPLPRPKRGDRPMVVVLDPGHGGLDPGAEHGGTREADLMLTFARELKEVLVRSGVADVVLTRDSDSFVPLESRIALAHRLQADVFLSLHADAAPEGRHPVGATIYTLSEQASDEASAALAQRHDRDSLMSGVDLSGEDDAIASVLMDMARRETRPRTALLAEDLLQGMKGANVLLNKSPLREAAFSVLKSPDIVSLLIEVGYMSSPQDLARLRDPAWRGRLAGAISGALTAWHIRDAAQGGLLRQ